MSCRPLASFARRQRKRSDLSPKVLVDQALGSIAIFLNKAENTATWHAERNGVAVSGVGAAELLQGPLTAFFASRQCPGVAIRAATAWAVQQASESHSVIGGFHSPLEQSVLRILLQAGCPVVAVLARPVAGAALRSEWRDAIAMGKLAVVSHAANTQRLTVQAAEDRNELAARLADRIVIAHASPGGRLAQQHARWVSEQLIVVRIDEPG